MKKFWCVWREDGGVPVKKYEAFKDAAGCAKALARKQPGDVFYVLSCKAAVVLESPNDSEPSFIWTPSPKRIAKQKLWAEKNRACSK